MTLAQAGHVPVVKGWCPSEMPDGTLSRVEHHPWYHRVWDANDTVLESDFYDLATLLGWDAAQTAASRQAYRDDVALSRRWKEDVEQAIAQRRHQRSMPVAVSA